MARINNGQLFPRLRVERMLFQMFHIFCHQFSGSVSAGIKCSESNPAAQCFLRPPACEPAGGRAPPAGFFPRRPDARCAAPPPVTIAVGKFRDDFFQRGVRRIGVLRQLQMPVRQLRERGGDLQGRRAWRIAKMVERDFRRRQILRVFGLDGREQRRRLRNHSGISQAVRGWPRWPQAAGSTSVSRGRWNKAVFCPAARCRRQTAN